MPLKNQNTHPIQNQKMVITTHQTPKPPPKMEAPPPKLPIPHPLIPPLPLIQNINQSCNDLQNIDQALQQNLIPKNQMVIIQDHQDHQEVNLIIKADLLQKSDIMVVTVIQYQNQNLALFPIPSQTQVSFNPPPPNHLCRNSFAACSSFVTVTKNSFSLVESTSLFKSLQLSLLPYVN